MKSVIECTNCGGGGSDLQFWITVGALAVAFLALLMSFRQFREWSRQLKARARFAVTVRMQNADSDGVLRTDGTVVNGRVEIGIKNNGERAATETLINAVYPRPFDAKWCGPNGEESTADSTQTPTSEVLVDGEHEHDGSRFLSRTLPRVGTKPSAVVFFQFDWIDVPQEGELRIPVRVRVQADEIPDDVEEYVEDLVVRIAPRGEAG